MVSSSVVVWWWTPEQSTLTEGKAAAQRHCEVMGDFSQGELVAIKDSAVPNLPAAWLITVRRTAANKGLNTEQAAAVLQRECGSST